MSDPSDLRFVDSAQDDDVLFEKPDSQTITFTNFPNSAVDDEEEDSGDKSQLLKDEKRPPSFWTFEYYQQFFDVETRQVGHRVLGSMLPVPTRNYLHTHIRPSPDLYGPFWICTTLVFTTSIAGNLANYLASGGKDYQWKYDFHKVTFAATAIFSYWWVIPGVMYGVLWWRKSQAGYTFMEILCLYGYSLAIYIPISILWVVNVTWFKWLLVVVGAVLSGGVLVISLWPAVREDKRQVAYAVIGLVFIMHLMLAAGFVLYFFHVPPAAQPSEPAITLKPPTAAPLHEKLNQQATQVNNAPQQQQQQQQKVANQNGNQVSNVQPQLQQQNVANQNGNQANNVQQQPKAAPQDVQQAPQNKLSNAIKTDTQTNQQLPVAKSQQEGNAADAKDADVVVKKAVSKDSKAVVDEAKQQLDALSRQKKVLKKRSMIFHDHPALRDFHQPDNTTALSPTI